MKLLYFDDFKLGALKGDAVVDVSAEVKDIPHICPGTLMNGLIEQWGSYKPRLEADVGYAPLAFMVMARKVDPDGVANLAVQAICADEPTRLQRSLRPAVANPRAHRVAVRFQIDELEAALNPAAEPPQFLSQDLLGDAFGQTQREREWRVQIAEPQRRLARSKAIKVDPPNDRPPTKELLRKP